MLLFLSTLLLEASHGHEGGSLWQEYWSLLTDPAHALIELTFAGVDILILGPVLFLLRRTLKKSYQRHMDRLHHELDREHGVPAHGETENHRCLQEGEEGPVLGSTTLWHQGLGQVTFELSPEEEGVVTITRREAQAYALAVASADESGTPVPEWMRRAARLAQEGKRKPR